jgi:N-acetylglucosaminyldiphosphoundecaprenol N-acetyl-beta-D-mannosaminyltransferase
MGEPKYVHTLGFKVYSDDLNLIAIDNKQAKVINTISPNSYGISTRDAGFCNALKKSDYLMLDGVYFAFASIFLQGKNIKRNQGPDIFKHFIDRCEAEKSRVFFLGSTGQTLKKIKERLSREYPGITAGSYSPPFTDEFSAEEDNEMVQAINEFGPDVLFVGMTCPKQEKWAVKNRASINAGLIISVGNVFDWFAGTQKEIKHIWYVLRLAWLVRIFLRPEIFRRNIGNQMKFFSDVTLFFLRLKKVKAE